MRRRLWWHICFIETCLADTQEPFMNIWERAFDTRQPANVNDADLNPEMKDPPAPREGYTEATITLMRCDMWKFLQKMKFLTYRVGTGRADTDSAIEEKLETLRNFRENILTRYTLRKEDPVQFTLALVFEVHINTWELTIHLLRQPELQKDAPDEKSIALALAIIRAVYTVQHSEATRRFAWLRQGRTLAAPCHSFQSHMLTAVGQRGRGGLEARDRFA